MGACSGKELQKEINESYLPLPQKISPQEVLELNNNQKLTQNEDKIKLLSYRMSYMNGIYKRNSFDRFGDDFCELILSFLSLEEMMRFECVNRQWNRCLFNRVFEIDYPLDPLKCFVSPIVLNDKQKYFLSKKLIKKCKYLKKLKISQVCDNEILRIVSQNNKFLEEIDISFDNLKPIRREIMSLFAINCGQRLKRIKISELSEECFSSESGLSLLIVFSEYFPKLQEIELSLDSDNCLKYFILFTDIYEQRIKSLKLRLKFSPKYKEVNQTFGQISRFLKLRKIYLILESVDRLELDFPEGLEILSKNCLDLRNISLEIKREIYSSTPILKAFESVYILHSIKLLIKSIGIQLGSIESLGKFWNLSKLHILYRHLNDEALNNINYYCPKLESIVLSTLEQISDKALYSLSKIPNLKKLSISGIPYRVNDITDSGVMSLLNNCKNLRIIEFKCGINITQLTFLTLNALAESSPQKRFLFCFCWKRSEKHNRSHYESSNTVNDIWPEMKASPENLKIESREYFVGWCGTGMIDEIYLYKRMFCENLANIE